MMQIEGIKVFVFQLQKWQRAWKKNCCKSRYARGYCGNKRNSGREALKKSIKANVPKGTEELNLKAFDMGYKHGRKLSEANFALRLPAVALVIESLASEA